MLMEIFSMDPDFGFNVAVVGVVFFTERVDKRESEVNVRRLFMSVDDLVVQSLLTASLHRRAGVSDHHVHRLVASIVLGVMLPVIGIQVRD